jgi:hypothetical protein
MPSKVCFPGTCSSATQFGSNFQPTPQLILFPVLFCFSRGKDKAQVRFEFRQQHPLATAAAARAHAFLSSNAAGGNRSHVNRSRRERTTSICKTSQVNNFPCMRAHTSHASSSRRRITLKAKKANPSSLAGREIWYGRKIGMRPD